jgi:hypothetical protein
MTAWRGRPSERWDRWCNTAATDAARTGPKGSLNHHGKRERSRRGGKKPKGVEHGKQLAALDGSRSATDSRRKIKVLCEKRSWWDGSSRPVRGWCAPRDSNPFPSLAMQRGEKKKEPDNNVQGISLPCRLQTRCSRWLLPLATVFFQPLRFTLYSCSSHRKMTCHVTVGNW